MQAAWGDKLLPAHELFKGWASHSRLEWLAMLHSLFLTSLICVVIKRRHIVYEIVFRSGMMCKC